MATILILALWLLRRELFFSVLRTGGLLQEMKVFLVANLFLSQRFLSVYLDSRPGCVSLFALSPGCGCLKFLGLCGLWFHTLLFFKKSRICLDYLNINIFVLVTLHLCISIFITLNQWNSI